MQRKYIFIFTIAFASINIFLLWRFVLLRTHIFLTTPEDYVSTTPSSSTPAPSTPASAAPAPAAPAPLPALTLDAQNTFYGSGCKENRYRKRLQVILREWGKLAKRRNITQYFICFGSFLGSVRNGDHIPYDSDVDVCMFRHEYWKLDPEESKRPVNLNDGKIHVLLQRHSPHPKPNIPRKDCKGNMVRRVVDDCSILNPHGRMYNGAHFYVDIFMIEDYGAKFWDEYRDKIHDRDAILPVKPCKFLGLDTKCPNNADKYLNVYYGKGYMTPL